MLAIALVPAAANADIGVRPAIAADDVTIQSFFGTYEGRTLMPMGEPHNRGLRVVIRPVGALGFTVEWLTALHKTGEQPEDKLQAIDFEPTGRPNVYAAAHGSASPGPADGEPYAWARLTGKTLSVNVLTIDDNGDYVVQTYDRTLTASGMNLDFLRVRNGLIERQIKGSLKRIGN
jgi:hypothetical protein